MQFRKYEDGVIIDEGNFDLADDNAQFTSDFELIVVSDEIVDFIQDGKVGTFDY